MPNFEDDSGNCHAPDPNGVACYKSRIGCPIHPRKKRKAMSDIQTLRAENERLREVLRGYAYPASITTNNQGNLMHYDGGARARAALEGKP